MPRVERKRIIVWAIWILTVAILVAAFAQGHIAMGSSPACETGESNRNIFRNPCFGTALQATAATFDLCILPPIDSMEA
jgi:hypothetical protein